MRGNSVEVTVDVVEPMGSISYVYLRPVDQSHEDTFVVEVDGQRPISEGERLHAYVPPEDVHLFDADSGETIHQRKLDAETEIAPQAESRSASRSAE